MLKAATCLILCATAASIFAGCAVTSSPEQLAQLQRLTPVKNGRSFELAAPLKVAPVYFAPGRYAAVELNESGTFYEGPPKSVVWETSGNRFMAYDGGIWISASQTEEPRIYTRNGLAIEYKGLEAALAGRAGSAPPETSVIPELMANPTLNPVRTALVGSVVEALVAEEMRKSIGQPSWALRGGKAVSFSKELLDRSVVWSK